MTIAEALVRATARLAPLAGEAARLEAEVLLAELRKESRARLLSELRRQMDPAEVAAFEALLQRRLQGEPVAYILGRREFMSLEFIVCPSVLIPRQETEVLVETALRLLATGRSPRPVVVDVGTGCGNIALSLAYYFPRARVVAVDVSSAALAVARANARRLGLGRRVSFLRGDLLEPLFRCRGRPVAADAGRCRGRVPADRRSSTVALPACPVVRRPSGKVRRVDLLVANLPYIPSADLAGLSPEVRYEPRLALDGGADGLELYRRLLRQTPLVVRPGGHVLLEMGAEQEAALRGLAAAAGLARIKVIADFAGRPRVLSGKFLGRRQE